MELKQKNVLFVGWGTDNPDDTYMNQIYYLMLKKVFPRLKAFDTKKNYFHFGKKKMNKDLVCQVKKQKPELILFGLNYDELYLETLVRIKKLNPKAKTAIIICDDDARFDHWSRYYALFFDAVIASPTSEAYLKNYLKDGIKNIFFHWDYNINKLRPMNLEKKYDLTFIGRPKADRNELFKYLLDNNINLSLFGWGWDEYPEFKEAYMGSLDQESYAKVLNQTKINLSPTKAGYEEQKNQYNFKGRFFEVALCKSFQLIEDHSLVHKFFKKNEIGLFSSREDLIKKIKYYLKNEKEREEMAKRSYERVIKNYNREKQLNEIFPKILNLKNSTTEKKINKKIKTLHENSFSLPLARLKKELKNFDYVDFDIGKNKRFAYKNYLQVKSIEKTGKPISCCDYYASLFSMQEHIIFHSNASFKRIGKKANNLINLNQLLIKKDFFLKNLDLFRDLANGRAIDLFNLENTAFVSIPLVIVNKFSKIGYDDLEKSIYMKFNDQLLTLLYQKKFYSPFPFQVILSSLFGKTFILKYLFKSFFKESNWEKLKVNKTYFSNSLFRFR